MNNLKYVQFLVMIHLIGVVKLTESLACGNSDIKITEGQLTKLTKISRYFVFTSSSYEPFESLRNFMEAKELCRAEGLSVADVQNEVDLESLRKFVLDSQMSYWIGMNDIQQEGHFLDGDGQPIEFQAFRSGSPDNDEDRNCVQIGPKNNASRFISMKDEDCLSTAGVLCQYQSRSFCYINSFQAVSEGMQLLQVGRSFEVSKSLKMYISRFQVTRDQAIEECTEHNGTLLTPKDYEIAMQLHPIVQRHHSTFDKSPHISYWISGSLMINSEENYPDYESHVPVDNYINLHIAAGPCAEISFTSEIEIGGPPLLPVIRPTICTIPKYFICIGEQLTDLQLESHEMEALLQNLIA